MFAHDLRYAARALVRRPGFTALVVLTLAMCIGVNTAIFSVVDAVLLKPLPYADPDRLVMVWSNDGQPGHERTVVSAGNYFDWRARTTTFESLGAYFSYWNATLTGDGDAVRIDVGATSANLFATLGVRPALGRGFLQSEEPQGGPRVVLLSYGFWERRFNADRAAIGRAIQLDGESYMIVGVMPREFRLPQGNVDVYAPLSILGRYLEGRIPNMLEVVGRLRPGKTLADARVEMAGIARQIEREYPETSTGWTTTLLSLREQVVGNVERTLLVLLGAVGFVLLIGCVNVANLLLVRAAGRQRELAVRTALGAGRARLVQHLFAESIVIAAAAGIVGLLLAVFSVRLLAGVLPEDIPRLNHVGLDARVLAFTALAALVTAIACGVLPVAHLPRLALHQSLKEQGRGTGGRMPRRLRSALVVSEIALAVVLTVGAGLLVRSFTRLRGTSPGFSTDPVVAMKVALPPQRYAPQRRAAFYKELIERTQRLPGVVAVGAVSRVPLRDNNITTTLLFESDQTVPLSKRPDAGFRIASADYFRAMGIPLLAGRTFTSADNADSGAVLTAIVNETLAERYFPGGRAVGARVKLGQTTARSPWFTIVGVVGDVHDGSLRTEPPAQLFVNFEQQSPGGLSLIVRTTGSVEPLVAAVRRQVTELDPALAVYDVVTTRAVVERATTSERFATMLLGAFSALALLLAAVGVYGVMAYSVTERTREIGVRMAFGARENDILRGVLGEVLRTSVVALAIGLLLARATSGVMSSLLYGVTATDPLTFGVAGAVVLAMALLACVVPARRAAKLDPVAALRAD
jgi:putative ABC transport system permease protein